MLIMKLNGKMLLICDIILLFHKINRSSDCCYSKFDVTPDIEKNLLSKCEPGSMREISMTDSYYDDSVVTLTKNGLWLRKRNFAFELKWPHKVPRNNEEDVTKGLSHVDSYNESSNWEIITSVIKEQTKIDMGLPPTDVTHDSSLLVAWLEDKSILPFAVIKTVRVRYPVNLLLPQLNISVSVNVDIDKVTYILDSNDMDETPDNCKYDLGEVEVVSSLPCEYNPRTVMFAIFQELSIISPASTASELEETSDSPPGKQGRLRRGKVEEFLFRFRPAHHGLIFGKC